MATLDELVVRIKADASQLDRELKRVSGVTQQETKKMAGALGTLGSQFQSLVPALGAAALIQFAKRSVDATGRMKDLGDQIGFAASTLSALEGGLATTGASLDQFATAVNLMNANVGQAAQDVDGKLAEAFTRLKLPIAELLRLSPEEQFYAIADALSRVATQYEQTELGRAIFGRGFANILPLIKEANGNLDEHVQKLKDTRDALSQETIDRIDAFGDALQSAGIKARNAFIEAFAELLRLNSLIADTFGKGAADGGFANWKVGAPGSTGNATLPPNVSTTAPANLSDEEVARIIREGTQGKAATRRTGGAGRTSGGGQKSTTPLPADYDSSAFQQYLADLNAEAAALGKSDRELAVRKALTEAQQAAQKDYAEGLRDTSLLYEDEAQQIEKLAGGFYDLQRQIEDSRETNREWTKQLADGLTDIALNFDSASSAAEGFFKQIASQILNKHVTGPMSEGIMGLIGGGLGGLGGTTLYEGFGAGAASRTVGGLGSLLGFADGGRPPVGVPSVVGERGPEIFVPDSAGTVVPNHSVGGGNTVTVVFNVSPGVQGTVEAEIRRAAPALVQMAHNSVFQAIQRGGPERRIVRP